MSDDVDAFLREKISKVKGLGGSAAEIASEAVKELRKELEAQVSRGETPAGERWRPTLAGDPPLQNADEAVTITQAGSVILYRVAGPTALHHLGKAKGRIRRQVIPDKIEPKMAAALKRAAETVIARKLGG